MLTQRIGWVALVLVGLTLTLPVQAGELKGLKKDFKKALVAEDPDRAASILDEIGNLSEEGVTEALFDLGVKYANTEGLYASVVRNIRKQSSFATQLTDKVDKGKFPEKVLVCDVVSGVETVEAVNLILPLLQDSNQFVQVSCTKALEKCMQREAIGPLIELYAQLTKKKTKDVIYYQVADTLFNLTGEDFELIADWRKWWEPIADSFDPKATDTGGQTGVVRKKRKGEPEFIGVPLESQNVCFVIDTSGGMITYVAQDIDIPGLGTGTGADGGGGEAGSGLTPENDRLAKFWTRIEMAKRALFMCIWEMDKATSFNVVTFDTNASKCTKKSLRGTPGGKKKAEKWIQDQVDAKRNKYRGGGKLHTNTLQALEYAFNSDPKINTIFFLSDGVPSKDGTNMDPTGPILDRVFEMNRFRKIKIHTFGFNPNKNGQDNGRMVQANKWLKELSNKTGGKFTMLKVDRRYTPDDPYGKKRRKKSMSIR